MLHTCVQERLHLLTLTPHSGQEIGNKLRTIIEACSHWHSGKGWHNRVTDIQNWDVTAGECNSRSSLSTTGVSSDCGSPCRSQKDRDWRSVVRPAALYLPP